MSSLAQGYELDRLTVGLPESVRWWFFVEVDDEDGRPQAPRLGVPGNGFRFARGGRADSREAAESAIAEARQEAERELYFWRGQPSHALGGRGELVPLDRVALPS